MLLKPKGYKYWVTCGDELKLKEDAPAWAKEEFEKYLKLMDRSSGETEETEVNMYY